MITKVSSQFINIKSATPLTAKGVRIDGGDLIYNDGVSEVTAPLAGGGGAVIQETVSFNIARTIGSTGVQTVNLPGGWSGSLTPKFFASTWKTGNNPAWGNGYAVYDGTTIAEVCLAHDQVNTNQSYQSAADRFIRLHNNNMSFDFDGLLQNITTTSFDINWTVAGSPAPGGSIEVHIVVAG